MPVGQLNTGSIVTALQIGPGQCSYDLSVTSDEDPIITDDHLAWGSGTYYNLYPAPRCVANQAPIAGWIAWNSSLSGGSDIVNATLISGSEDWGTPTKCDHVVWM